MLGTRRIAATLAAVALAAPSMAQAPASTESLPLGAPRTESAPQSNEQLESDGPGLGIVRTAGSLAAVIGLIVLLAAVGKKLAKNTGGLAAAIGPGGKAPSGVLFVLARYPIARGQTLVLLRVGTRVLLVHQTGGKSGSMQTLCEITDAAEVAELIQKTDDNAGKSMAAELRKALDQAAEEPIQIEMPRTEPRPVVSPVVRREAADRAPEIKTTTSWARAPEAAREAPEVVVTNETPSTPEVRAVGVDESVLEELRKRITRLGERVA